MGRPRSTVIFALSEAADERKFKLRSPTAAAAEEFRGPESVKDVGHGPPLGVDYTGDRPEEVGAAFSGLGSVVWSASGLVRGSASDDGALGCAIAVCRRIVVWPGCISGIEWRPASDYRGLWCSVAVHRRYTRVKIRPAGVAEPRIAEGRPRSLDRPEGGPVTV